MTRRLVRALATLTLLVPTLPLVAPSPALADVITLLVSEDTSPYSFLPSLPRYNNPTAYAFRGVDETEGSAHEFETFLWFDVSAANIPPGHVLTSAQLVVTHAFDATGFGDPSLEPAELRCHEVTEPWDQTTLTWLNKPAYDAPFDHITDITAFGSLICDATLVVFDWIHGTWPNDGFALTNGSERVIGMHTLEATSDIPDSLKANLILTTALPEPGFASALGIGGLALAGVARRARRRAGMRGPR